MDKFEFLANINLLAYPHSLENRLKLMLENTRAFLKLNICSILFLTDNGRKFDIISCGEHEELVSEYREKFLCLDQYHDFPDGEIVVFHPSAIDDSAAGREFSSFCSEKVHIKSVAGADFKPHQNLEVRVRFTRNHQQEEFTEADIRVLEKLLLPLRDAINAGIDHQHRMLFDLCAQKLLSRFRIGMLLLSKQMEILGESPLAQDLLERTHAYHKNKSKLVGRSREYQELLEQSAHEIEADNELYYRAINIKTADKTEHYTIVIARKPDWRYLLPGTDFITFIFSSLEENMDSVALLRQWRISPAEQKVLAAIIRFDNVKKVAIELNISPNTAKAQLKSAYRKLGIDSKMMLLKRLNMVRNIEALLH